MDLFRCESILLRSHWVMVVMDRFTRRIIGFGVEGEILDGVAVCRVLNSSVVGQPLAKHISTGNDPLFRFHRWRANLWVCGIDEIKSVPYVPRSHLFVERLIGTVRREYLDPDWPTNPASSRNPKPPPLGGGVFTRDHTTLAGETE